MTRQKEIRLEKGVRPRTKMCKRREKERKMIICRKGGGDLRRERCGERGLRRREEER